MSHSSGCEGVGSTFDLCNIVVNIMSYNHADRSTQELPAAGTDLKNFLTHVVPFLVGQSSPFFAFNRSVLTTVCVDAAVVQESNPEVVQDSRFMEETESC